MATTPTIDEGPTPTEDPAVPEPEPASEPEPEPAAASAPTDGQDEYVDPLAPEPTSVEEPVTTAPPAFDLTDPDIAFIVEKYGNDPNVVARELHALNNRMAEQSRQPTAAAAPAREDSPTAQQSIDLPAEAEAEVWRLVHQDQECSETKEEYEEVKAQINELAQVNRRNQVVGGELLSVDREYIKLDNDIKTTKALLAGAGRIPLDEYQKTTAKEALAEMKEQLAEIKERREAMVANWNELKAKAKRLGDKFQARYDGYRNRIKSQFQSTQSQRQEQQVIQEMASKFTKEWDRELAVAFTALKIPNDPKLRARLATKARNAGMLATNPSDPRAKGIPTGGTRAFIEGVFKEELQDAEFWKRQGAGTYAGQKRRDVTPQAPGGRAAVAPPDPANSTDWKDRFRARAEVAKKKLSQISANEVFKRETGRPTV